MSNGNMKKMENIENIENRKKRIAIDTVFFNLPYSGISRVWETLLNHLNTDLVKIEIILLIRGKEFPNIISKYNLNKKYLCIHINELAYPLMHQDVDNLNQICKTNKIDYFLSTYFTYCTSIPNILLIHDMIPEIFKMPKNHMWMQKELAIHNASQFITISETTKKDLIKYYPHLETEKYPITVIHNAVPAINSTGREYDNDFLNEVLIKNGIHPKKYILAISTNSEKYKNQELIKSLVDTYRIKLSILLGNASIPLVIITKNIPNNIIITNGLLLLSNVSDAILNTLYKNALCFISTSLYEGFGLPVFEAFAYETPVIAVDIPVLNELCSSAITYIQNDVNELWDKICFIVKGNSTVQKRIENGTAILERYSIEKHIQKYTDFFNTLNTNPTGFINLILQSYNEPMPERRAELEYCILANLENPYVQWVHDFANTNSSNSYLPESIFKHRKYIRVSESIHNNKWLTYSTAFTYSNDKTIQKKYGYYWGIINVDIFLDNASNWALCRSWLNRGYILAQSRYEFPGEFPGEARTNAKMDANFSKMLHANTQDGWFYKAPINVSKCEFEIGMLGCDNAIADRIIRSSYKIANMPITWKIMHYDIAKGKNSSNYLEKHKLEAERKNKPINTHPEREGQFLVPNYDSLVGIDGDIDLISIINQLGGISNMEKYKLICEMFSNRIIIFNQ